MLSATRAIILGHRRRRRGAFWVAACLLLVATGIGVRTGQQFARGIDPDTLKPDWFLLWQAGSSNSTTRAYAIDLLLKREGMDGLDANEMQKLSERIVAADLAGGGWKRGWGGWVLASAQDAKIPPASAQALLRRRFDESGLRVRPRIHAGDPLPYERAIGSGKTTIADDASRSLLRSDPARAAVLIDGRAVDPAPAPDKRVEWIAFVMWSGRKLDGATTAGLAPGTHTLRVRDHFTFAEDGPPAPQRIPFEFNFDATTEFEVVSADVPIIARVHDPALVDAVTKSFKIGDMLLARYSRSDGKAPRAGVSIDIINGKGTRSSQLPAEIAYEVLIRQNGKEWPIGFIAKSDAEKVSGWGRSGEVPGLVVGTADVILRPSEAAAMSSVGVTSLFDHELVFPNVRVTEDRLTQFRAASRPAATTTTAPAATQSAR